MEPDPVRVVHEAYDLRGSTEEWLRRIVDAINPWMNLGYGTMAYRFYVDDSGPQYGSVVSAGADSDWLGEPQRFIREMPVAVSKPMLLIPPMIGWGSIEARSHVGAPEYAYITRFFASCRARFGFDDVFALHVQVSADSGFDIGFPGVHAPIDDAHTKNDVCAHITMAATARLVSASPAVMMDDRGVVLDSTARTATEHTEACTAARRVSSVRRRIHPDAAGALAKWSDVLSGGWIVLRSVDTDGKRLTLVRRRPNATLTQREQRIVGAVAQGASNKSVAIDLGLSEATVSGTVRSALKKLGLQTRVQLARWWEAMHEAD